MEILLFIFLQWISVTKCSAQHDKTLNVTTYFVAVATPLTLNCSPWADNLSAQEIFWKRNHKAWLMDHTRVLNGSQTVQLNIPKVSYADEGIYQCCIYRYDKLGLSRCACSIDVNIGEKPNVSWIKHHFDVVPYGFPPQLLNIILPTVGYRGKYDNGKPWKYEIYYRYIQSTHFCTPDIVNRVANWCTQYSSSTKKLFVCNFTRVSNKHRQEILTTYNSLCFNVAVTNDFGTQTFNMPFTFRDFSYPACTKPRNIKVQPVRRRTLRVSFDVPLFMPMELMYTITYCNLGSTLFSKFPISTPGCGKMSGTNTTQILSSLLDFTTYKVSVTCQIILKSRTQYALVAGPVIAKTEEAAPDESPHIVKWRPDDSETCTASQRRVRIFWKLPSKQSWNGLPRKIVLQYWQASNLNGTKNSTAVKLNVSNLEDDQKSATNITLPCYLDSEVQIKLCTIACGRWSSASIVSAYNVTSPPQIVQAETLSWKIILAIVVGTLMGIASLLAVIYFLHRLRQSTSETSSFSEGTSLETRMDVHPQIETESERAILTESGVYDES